MENVAKKRVKSGKKTIENVKNITRVQNCPDITISNPLFFVIGLLPFVFLLFHNRSKHHSNQMSEGPQVSKITVSKFLDATQYPNTYHPRTRVAGS